MNDPLPSWQDNSTKQAILDFVPGGIEFMRAWSEQVNGIPPELVVVSMKDDWRQVFPA